jgi:hypothetical protein
MSIHFENAVTWYFLFPSSRIQTESQTNKISAFPASGCLALVRSAAGLRALRTSLRTGRGNLERTRSAGRGRHTLLHVPIDRGSGRHTLHARSNRSETASKSV